MYQGTIAGFEAVQVPGDGVEISALVGGEGPPLLLLHGYPQTRMIWAEVAQAFREDFTLVIPDLRGYGRSEKPRGDIGHHAYSKRQMGQDQLATMRYLGFNRFSVAGHDRGARVAYRLALDTPEAVEKLCVMDIIPTSDMWLFGPPAIMGLFQWTFLAQPEPLPEMLLEGRGREFMTLLFERWSMPGFSFEPNAMNDYLTSNTTPDSIHASCEDYRAGWHVDRIHDEEDRQTGRRLSQPLLVLWGQEGAAHKAAPLEIWRNWADDLQGHAVSGGHFVPEEAASEVVEHLRKFLKS